MQSNKLKLQSVLLSMLLCGAASAQAGIVVYTDRDAFLAASGAYGIDDFDDIDYAPYGATMDRSAGAYGYRVTAPGDIFGAGEGNDGWYSTNRQLETSTFSNFAPGVSGFGGYFFGSDRNGAFLGGATLYFSADDGAVFDYTLSNATRTSFLGFLSDSTLNAVSITSSGVHWTTANDLILATPAAADVPEPESFAMLGLGLGLLGWMRRRRG